jgi:hypothetical protein
LKYLIKTVVFRYYPVPTRSADVQKSAHAFVSFRRFSSAALLSLYEAR